MKKKTLSLSSLPPAARCAIYCRFSDQDPDSKGAYSSNDAQEAACRRFIEEAGGTTIAVFTDEGKTGMNFKRAGWRKLVESARDGKFTHVVVTYADRLARSDNFAVARYILGEAGVSVACSIEQFGEGLAGTMQHHLSMLLSGILPAIVSEKTRSKHAEMTRAGYWTGGRRNLFGLASVPVAELSGTARTPPKRLVIVEEEAEAIREAFAAFIATDSLRSASDILQAASDRAWPDHATRNLLSSGLMIGSHTWGDVTNPAFCPPIVSRETFDAAQRLLSGRKKGNRRATLTDPETLLGETMYLLGVAHCACGRRLTMYGSKGNKGKRYNYYRCPARKEGLCDAGDLSAARLHQSVIGGLLALARTPWRLRVLLSEVAKTYGDTGDVEKELVSARRKSKAIDTQEGRIAAAIGMSPVEAIPALTNQLGRLALERQQAKRRVEALEAEIARSKEHRPDRAFLESVLGQLSEAWDLATEKERRELIQLLVARVEVRTTGLDVWLFEAAEVESLSKGQLSAPGRTRTCDLLDRNQML